jgi:YVTN family beta-propeller protein
MLRAGFFGRLMVGAAMVTSAVADPRPNTEPVGRADLNRTITPVNQVLTPFGRTIELAGLRPQALALSPDGRMLVVAGNSNKLTVLDAGTGEIRQQVPFPSEKQNEPQPDVVSPNLLDPDKKGELGYGGLIFAHDGRRIFLSNVNGSIKVFAVDAAGAVRPSHSFALPPANAPRRKEEIPSGLALSADGRRLYVCGNLSNQLLELDAASGRVLRRFPVGVAPCEVALVGAKAYVSNWGGRRPGPGDLTGPAGRGTVVRVSRETESASEGSVSIVPLAGKGGAQPAEVLAGRHASALAVSPGGRYVVCANAAADSLSVIDTRTDLVAETIGMKAKPSELFGASPNALAFEPSGRRLYVANGTQNAVAVVRFDPADRESKLEGLIPVGWFPAALAFDAARGTIWAANLKGLPEKKGRMGGGRDGRFQLEAARRLALAGRDRRGGRPAGPFRNGQPQPPARVHPAGGAARACRTSRGGPSRSASANRAASDTWFTSSRKTAPTTRSWAISARAMAIRRSACFGEDVTPNQHRLAREFVLLDNTYCAGILSADGHQWSTTAFATDYLEKSFAGFPRSYPDGMGPDEADALAYAPSGFLWDHALRRGVSLRNYGEFMAPAVRWRDGRRGSPDFLACHRTWRGESDAVVFGSQPMVENLPAAFAGGLRGLGNECAGPIPGGLLPARTPRKRGPRRVSRPDHHLPAQRSHQRNQARFTDPRRLCGGQRPGLRTHRRGPEPLEILEGNGDPRDRGRPAGGLGPRQRLPHDSVLHQPVGKARCGGRHAVQHHQPAPHHRAGARVAGDEPVRCERDADV